MAYCTGSYDPTTPNYLAAKCINGACNTCADCVTYLANLAGGGGDPITYFRGKEYKFTIPNRELTEFVVAGDITIKASCFPGAEKDEQWIDRVVVERADNVVADIRQRDMLLFDHSKLSPGELSTLQVRLPWLHGDLLTFSVNPAEIVDMNTMIFGGTFVHPSNDVTIDLIRFNDLRHDASTPQREGLMFETPVANFVVSTSSAKEYYWDHPDLSLRMKYAHLDIHFTKVKEEHSWKGLLPRLWGLANSTSHPSVPASEIHAKRSSPDADPVRHRERQEILGNLFSDIEEAPLGTAGVCGDEKCSSDSARDEAVEV